MNDVAVQIISNIFKALSSHVRVKIVEMLKDGPLCVCKIIEGLGMEQSNTSQHLSVLKNAGIVESRKEGLSVYYKLKYPEVLDMINLVEGVLNKQLEETKLSLEERRENNASVVC